MRSTFTCKKKRPKKLLKFYNKYKYPRKLLKFYNNYNNFLFMYPKKTTTRVNLAKGVSFCV